MLAKSTKKKEMGFTTLGVKLIVAYELGIFTRLERKSIIGNNKE